MQLSDFSNRVHAQRYQQYVIEAAPDDRYFNLQLMGIQE